MITFIVITALYTTNGQESQASIRARDITALGTPQNKIGCAISHKDLEEEVFVKESCAMLTAQLNAKPAKATKKKKTLQWSTKK